MGFVSNIVCKTIGFAGASAILYDAYKTGHKHSLRGSQYESADRYEKMVADQRTASTESHVSSAIQNKVNELRMENPIIPIWGRIKGFFNGCLESMGNNIIPVIFTSFALTGKNFFAKLGAWGLVGCGLYTVVKEGFGVGKYTAVDK